MSKQNQAIGTVTVLWTWADGAGTEVDEMVSDLDDGELHLSKEAREKFNDLADKWIGELQRLKLELASTSIEKFFDAHGIKA